MNLTKALILTTLLLPIDFGLMAIASSIIFFIQGITETGLRTALTQKKGNIEEYLDIAWTIEFIRNLILFIILYISAPYLASFFQESRILLILRTTSIGIIISGFDNIRIVYYRRNLEFSKQFLLDIIPISINIICTIILAIVFKNIWALIVGFLVHRVVLCILSYILYPHLPKIKFDKKKSLELLNFGKWIFGSAIAVQMRKQGITMFIGKIFSLGLLGYYNRAVVFSQQIIDELIKIFWQVGFPAFSSIQNNRSKVKRNYIKLLSISAFIGMPISMGLFILTEDFIYLFLQEEWWPIIPLMKLFAIQGLLISINSPSGIVMQSIGRPDISTKISIMSVIIIVIIIYPFSYIYGLEGVVLTLLISNIITSPINWFYIMKLTDSHIMELIKSIIFPLFITMLMASSMVLVENIFVYNMNKVFFILIILFGILIYFAIAYLLEKTINYQGLILIRERLVALRS